MKRGAANLHRSFILFISLYWFTYAVIKQAKMLYDVIRCFTIIAGCFILFYCMLSQHMWTTAIKQNYMELTATVASCFMLFYLISSHHVQAPLVY